MNIKLVVVLLLNQLHCIFNIVVNVSHFCYKKGSALD